MLDLTDYKTLRDLLKRFGVWTKKRLGQHFLVDRSVLEQILETADVQEGEYITEIGAGHGVLTVELLRKGAKVNTIEIDEDILPVLRFTTRNHTDKLEIFPQHVLGYTQKNFPYKIVANIPYQLTSPILRKFLAEAEKPPQSLTLLTQKEVAERICDPKRNSILSLIVSVFGQAEIKAIVGENSFFPPPKVKSAILHIKTFAKPKITIARQVFYNMVKIGFLSPRKKLKNVLAGAFHKNTAEIEALFTELGIPADARAENLAISDWESLARILILKYKNAVFCKAKKLPQREQPLED